MVQIWEEQLIWNSHKDDMDILQIHSASDFAIQYLYIDILKNGRMKIIDKNNLNIGQFGGVQDILFIVPEWRELCSFIIK